MLAYKPDDLSSIPETHVVEEENQQGFKFISI